MILKAEHPDYIHANFINVSTCTETNSLLSWLIIFSLTFMSPTSGLQAKEGFHHHTGTDGEHNKGLLEDGL